MERRTLAAILVPLVLVGPGAGLASDAAGPNSSEGWKLSSQSGGVALYSRPRPSSPLKEFKAVGAIEAPTKAVHNVLDDVRGYPNFMPFTAECRVVGRDGDAVITYQRLSPKICSDRDYTIRIHQKSWAGPGGLIFLDRWESANELGPAEKKDVLRVKLCEGAWLLEPDGANRTRATYSIYSDSGGALPAFLANGASAFGIKKIFAAVRKQVKDPKYSGG